MKKSIIALAALTLLVGCMKEIDPINENYIEKEFTASFEQEAKTSIDNAGKVDWCKDDVISYYTATEGEVSSISVSESSHTVSFSAKVGVDDSFIVAAYGGEISAPQGKSMTLTDVVEAEQTGKFEDAHISVCKRYFENGNNLSFKNITSLIKFSLERTDVRHITFTANDGTKIHGDGKIYFTFNGENLSAAFGSSEGGSSINVTVDGAGTFYIASLPCGIKGFSISFLDKDKKLLGTVSSEKTLTLGSGKIVNLGILDSKIEDPETIDLSANGTANCYIASKAGYPYKFNATVKGNSAESVGTPKKAKVLWESFGSDVAPSIGDVVSDVSLDRDYIKFTSGKDGNAVIAVVDSDNEIIWSWHIWVCDGFDPDATAQDYNNAAGTMMDRNIGALSANSGDVKSLGLLYQWGRKDPFLNGNSISSNIIASSTLSWPNFATSEASTGTIAYTVSHPTTFITSNANNYDWYYSSTSVTDNSRWQTGKTIFDPCPVGWKVPCGGSNGLWATAFGASSEFSAGPWDDKNKGMDFGSGNGKSSSMQLGPDVSIWFPAAGSHRIVDGALIYVGESGYYWSSTPTDIHAYYLSLGYDGGVNPSGISTRADGFSVRCVSESCSPIIPVTGVEINIASLNLIVGDSFTLSASVIPSNANVQTIKWTSDNESIATISENGIVTAISEGECSISAKSYNGIESRCSIAVIPKFDGSLTIDDITYKSAILTIKPNIDNTYYTTLITDEYYQQLVGAGYSDADILCGIAKSYAESYEMDLATYLGYVLKSGEYVHNYTNLDSSTKYTILCGFMSTEGTLTAGYKSISFSTTEKPAAEAAYTEYLGTWKVKGNSATYNKTTGGFDYGKDDIEWTATVEEDFINESYYFSFQNEDEKVNPVYNQCFDRYTAGYVPSDGSKAGFNWLLQTLGDMGYTWSLQGTSEKCGMIWAGFDTTTLLSLDNDGILFTWDEEKQALVPSDPAAGSFVITTYAMTASGEGLGYYSGYAQITSMTKVASESQASKSSVKNATRSIPSTDKIKALAPKAKFNCVEKCFVNKYITPTN